MSPSSITAVITDSAGHVVDTLGDAWNTGSGAVVDFAHAAADLASDLTAEAAVLGHDLADQARRATGRQPRSKRGLQISLATLLAVALGATVFVLVRRRRNDASSAIPKASGTLKVVEPEGEFGLSEAAG